MAQCDFENLLKQSIGLDSASIGKANIERSVRLRMETVGAADVENYWHYLHSSADELQELIEAVVVPETWFFRDPDAFAALARLAVEEWRPAHPHGVLRLLSIPCSTGEEPYSMIMALLDSGFRLEELHVDCVDVSTRALARAKQAVYGSNSFRGRDTAFRERYFRPAREGCALPEWFSEKANFRQGNLLSADRFCEGPYDVIFCRNLLIYFDRPTQELAMAKLARLLAPSGYLFVGPAEAFVASCSGFASLNQAMSFAFGRTAPSPVSAAASLPRRPKPLRRELRPSRVVPASMDSVCVPIHPPPDLGAVRRLADTGRLHEAAESCERHLQQHGPSAEAYCLLGLVRGALGDQRNAAENYRKTLYLDPDHTEALAHLSVLTEAHGDIAGARRLRERSRRIERRAE